MKIGTRTLLFGVHQVIWHPLLVVIAWVKLYKSFPNWRELFCIVIHDWGYWGKVELKNADGDKHPELGAKIATKLLGLEWGNFILGHSTFYVKRNNLTPSKMMAPDKYWHCIIPLWVYKIMSVPTGEFKHYREIKHARQVAHQSESDLVWWQNLQEVCLKKVNESYTIHMESLDESP